LLTNKKGNQLRDFAIDQFPAKSASEAFSPKKPSSSAILALEAQ
jgi:hypothetical protein